MNGRHRFGRTTAIFGLAILALVMTGCSERGPESRPQPPAQWDGGNISPDAPLDDRSMSLRILPDGEAELVNVPAGRWQRTDQGICWDETDEVYSGAATWSFFKDQGIEVAFEDSAVIFWAWPGKFGSYDWSEMKMVSCEGDVTWGMGLTCGSAGLEDLSACREP